jgi:hypothetical protein
VQANPVSGSANADVLHRCATHSSNPTACRLSYASCGQPQPTVVDPLRFSEAAAAAMRLLASASTELARRKAARRR